MSPSQVPPGVDAGLPESRVLIIGTGGTICMQDGPDGLAPSEGFLESAMAPRPTFNDMSGQDGESVLFLASLSGGESLTQINTRPSIAVQGQQE